MTSSAIARPTTPREPWLRVTTASANASGRGSAERLIDRALQILGIEHTLPLGEAQDERVNRSKLLLLQLDAHSRQLLGQPPPPGRGADLPVLGRVTNVLGIDERGAQ